MLEETLDVYRELQEHLDKFVVGFPATESGADIRVLKHLFTPEEAKLATRLSDKFESVDFIYERVNDLVGSPNELKIMLDNLVSKGSIHYKIRDGEKLYANAYLAIGMYEYQLHRLTKEFLEDMSQYANEAFGLELFGYGVTQFRTIPVEESVTPEHLLPTYDELTKIIENIEGPLVLMNCLCRQAQEMIGEPCKVTSRQETCLGFGDLAQVFIDEGWGRSISKQKALEVLRKNEEDGLVLQGQNAQRPEFICSCCGCCCGVLSTLKKFPNVAQFLQPRYHAEINPELCVGCGTCIDRCQLDAIKMRNEKSRVNIKRCVGCGNCVAVCPEDAITLNKRDKVDEPPENEEKMFEKILAAKMRRKGNKK
ncbi:MAG: 4Fe-4S dicluster domain-containing protein [Promethearchaeota archaeon]|nr:MAG: 4Fe-4S dicluster domain-containing protein [Candidatus Lokiarchaeota archaeon]